MAINTLDREQLAMEHRIKQKRISVSKQRQITLPKEFYDQLGIGDEVFVELHNNRLVIRPVREGDDFAEEILKELVAEGFEGEELIREFNYRRKQIRPAFLKLLEEAKKEAEDVSSLDELFEDDSK